MKPGAQLRTRVAAVAVGWSFSAANVEGLSSSAARPSQGLSTWLSEGEPQISAIRRHFADLAAIGIAPLLSRGEAAGLEGRLLVLWGEADDFFRRASVDALVAAVPHARLENFAGAGHLEPFAPPHSERTWQLIAEFGQ